MEVSGLVVVAWTVDGGVSVDAAIDGQCIVTPTVSGAVEYADVHVTFDIVGWAPWSEFVADGTVGAHQSKSRYVAGPSGARVTIDGALATLPPYADIPDHARIPDGSWTRILWQRVDGTQYGFKHAPQVNLSVDPTTKCVVATAQAPDLSPAAVVLECGALSTAGVGTVTLPYNRLPTGQYTVFASSDETHAVPATMRLRVVSGILAEQSVQKGRI